MPPHAMSQRSFVRWTYLLTFLTGAAGLIYQVAWQRYLTRLLGSDALATATVLGVFLSGLSLGYLVCGRLTVRVRNLFRAYGLLEGLIGAWALLFPLLFGAVEWLTRSWRFEPPWGMTLQGTLCAVALMGLPTLCMGGTVPMLTRGLARSFQDATGAHARVYAVNTAGAFLGTLTAGFALLHLLGLPGTVRLAGLLNLAAAAFFVAAGRRFGGGIEEDETRQGELQTPARAPAWALYAIVFLSGFYFMTLETLVIRLAGLSLGTSAFSFSLVVAVFVLSVALGAFLVARRRSISPGALLLNQIAICAGLAVLFFTLDAWTYGAHLLRIQFPNTLGGFLLYYVAAFAVLFLVLVVPAGLMGATLPLAFHALKRNLRDVGLAAGSLFAWNAAGSLLGGIAGGFLLYRVLGNGEIFVVVLAAAAVAAGLAATWLPRRPRLLAAATALFVLVVIWIFPFDPLRYAVGTFRLRKPLPFSYDGADAFYREYYKQRTVLAYRDDPEGTFAAVENPRPAEALATRFPGLAASILGNPGLEGTDRPRPRSILVNGKPDSSTWFDRETLLLLAHLPALFAAERDRVLLIGLGTGVTAGEVSLYPDVGSIEVAEISPGVTSFLPFFSASTHDVHEDPRLKVHAGDAFRIIGRGEQRWNLILSQPSNPWVSGVDQMYSREFYRIVKQHLEPGGLLVQWIQQYTTTEAINAIAINTLRSEFDHVRIFRAEADDLIIASTAPITDDPLAQLEAVLQDNEALRASLATIGIATASDVLEREHPETLDRAVRRSDLGIETLDHPRIHYLSGLAFFRQDTPDEGG